SDLSIPASPGAAGDAYSSFPGGAGGAPGQPGQRGHYGAGGGGGGGGFAFADVGGTGTINGSIACYCPGTLIETQRGEKPVEKLEIGDEVMTASGVLRPIKWIGRRSYGGRFVMGRKDILPICIKAGALGEDLPRRDLWISPHHAMYLEGALIEAKDLVNGASIVQFKRADKVEYFHIELDSHDVIIAEGSPSESFIDDDSRGMFHNAHEYGALYPDAAQRATLYYAPRLDSGYEVEAARRHIDARAGLRDAAETQPQTLRGHVDVVTPDLIAGWAQNPEHPEAPVCLDIFAGDRLIGRTLANRYRDDLADAGLGSGNHCFEFKVKTNIRFEPRSIEVRRSLDGSILDLSDATRRAG
ncbi:MAG: Hint domain-containing protein, partial [Bradyrhizobium sp.]